MSDLISMLTRPDHGAFFAKREKVRDRRGRELESLVFTKGHLCVKVVFSEKAWQRFLKIVNREEKP